MAYTNMMLDFLNHQHYQSYFTPIAKFLKSIEAAILLSEFVQRHQYHEANNELKAIPDKGGGWFYHTREAIEDRTAISKRQMDYGIEILRKHRLIETTNYGLPCRRYFRLNLSGIEELSKNLSSLNSVCKLDGSVCANSLEHTVQTDTLYIEEPNKEPKEERGSRTKRQGVAHAVDTPPPIPSKKKDKKEATVPFGEHVLLREGEYESLCGEIGKALVDYYILAINNHVPNSNRIYKNYAAVIKQWHLRDKTFGKLPNSQKIQEMNPTATTSDSCAKNKYLAELAEQKLSHLFNGRVYFQAMSNHGLIVHLDKDIKKEINYSAYDTPKFKEFLIRELEMCFPSARNILMGHGDNKVVNILNNLASKFKTTEAGNGSMR